MQFTNTNTKTTGRTEPILGGPPSFVSKMRVLGVPIDLVDLQGAARQICEWAHCRTEARMIFVRDVASLMLAVEQPRLLRLHDEASLVVADGMPLVWIGRMRGHGNAIGRAAGADLVDAVCRLSVKTGQSHFLYGGKPGVAQKMANMLVQKYPELKIAGIISPPMRDVGPDFTVSETVMAEMNEIMDSGADFIWVGISSPKQEYWMASAISVIGHGVCIGVGAAFDFHSETVKRAPAWMRDNGMEWLHRLIMEPRRLWRRYLILGPVFGFKVGQEMLTHAWRRR